MERTIANILLFDLPKSREFVHRPEYFERQEDSYDHQQLSWFSLDLGQATVLYSGFTFDTRRAATFDLLTGKGVIP